MKLVKTLVLGIVAGILIYGAASMFTGCTTGVGVKLYPPRIEIEAPVDK